jgi:ubiquinone/menaquinone biosynthesis C-methylase UbiE
MCDSHWVKRHDAVRRSYDAVAGDYAADLGDELTRKPLDRALLACLIEQAEDGAPMADVGCGPGHVAGWLAGQGVSVAGIDLSAGMVTAARRAFPAVEFRQGDFLALPARDAEFGAVVALYSIIHLGPDELARAFGEIHRVLRPSGLALISFHIGSEVRHLSQWWSHEVDLDFRFLEVPEVAEAMERAGFAVELRLERTSYPGEVETRRGYLMGRRG